MYAAHAGVSFLKGVNVMVWPVGLKLIFGLLLVAMILWTVLAIWKAIAGKYGWVRWVHHSHKTHARKGS